jgi:hypothetical protein
MGDAEGVYVLNAGDWLRLSPLPPGIHVMATGNVNNAADPRVAYARAWLHAQPCTASREWLAALQVLCAHPGGDGTPAICLHGERGGTVSSSLLALPRTLSAGTYRHAQGPPDQVPHEDYSHLLRQLAAPADG